MRLLESASLLFVAVALIALTFRVGSVALRRGLFAATAGLMVLSALIDGARWQLVPAYVVTALGGAFVLRRNTGVRPIGKVLFALRVVASALALFVAELVPAALPVPSFPPPDGPHPVGMVTFVLEDPARKDDENPGRHRRLLVQAYYPADASALATPRVPYMPQIARTGSAYSRMFGLPSFFLNHLGYAFSHSHENVPFSPSLGRAPVLIYSPGFRFTHTFNTTTIEALASQGYVVIAVDHTYDASAVVFPDGSVALGRAASPAGMTREEEVKTKTFWTLIRAADVRFILDTLTSATGAPMPAILAGHLDAARIGVLGHSLGGSTAIETCRTDARVVACADLDGQVYGDANVAGLAQPFLLVENADREDTFDAFVELLGGPSCRVRAAPVNHLDFSDIPLILPLLRYALPRLGKTNAGGEEMLGEMHKMLTAFFDATLRGEEAKWSSVKNAGSPFSSECKRLPGP